MFYRLLRVFWALLFAALIWWIGPLISIGVYRPLGWLFLRQCLVVGFLIWGFWPWLVILWAKFGMGVRQFQVAPSINSVDPLTGRLKDLDRHLKAKWLRQTRSRWQHLFGLAFKEHRQSLPWYLVIGPEGSGKTSWIAQLSAQGASFEKTEAEVNFWLTQTGVWFDTPGRWMAGKGMSDSDQHTWHQLLQGLRQLRGARSVVNGVILCVDIDYLLRESLEERKRLAESIRERLIDTQERWGLTANVYVALTGLDKVVGANALLSQMDAKQLSQGIGFVLPFMGIDSVRNDEQWRQALLEMEARVQTQVLYNAAHDTSQKGGHQLPFVEFLARLRSPLVDFLQMALTGADRVPHAELRGVWFGARTSE